MHDIKAVRYVISELEKLEEKPKKIIVELGRIKGNPNVFRALFKQFTQGTGLSGIELEVDEVPVEIRCRCGFAGRVKVIEHLQFARCPKCGKVAEILQGDKIEIKY